MIDKQSIQNTYQKNSQRFKEAYGKEQQLSRTISVIRVALFLEIIYTLYTCLVTAFAPIYLGLFIGGIIAFLIMVKWHQRKIERAALLKQLYEINDRELESMERHKAVYPGGEEFLSAEHDYALDLDLFGPQALFAFINRTGTAAAYAKLGDVFLNPPKTLDEITSRQESVSVLSSKLAFRQNFQANASLVKSQVNDMEELKSWMQTTAVISNSTFWSSIRYIAPVLFVTLLIFSLYVGNYSLLGMLIPVNMLLLAVKVKHTNQEQFLLGKRQKTLMRYAALLKLIEVEDFGSTKLINDLQKRASNGAQAIEELSKIAAALDQRLNLFAGLFLNLTGLYDFHCLYRVERWKAQHKEALEQWIDTVSEFEVLNSLATFAYNQPTFTMPILEENAKEQYIEAQELGHPLLSDSQRVCSDVSLGYRAKVYVVTGSNMAGKSTFLRSVAINLLLARMGTVVCATKMQSSIMRIITSMRVQDSISQNTSYFQAELLRMQHIIHELQKGEPTFLILDEILKGTNSEDKLLGSQLLVERFLHFNNLALIATHDLELGNMEEESLGKIENLCFESSIQEGDLHFDYKLRKGIAKNKNATFLMHKMEIVELGSRDWTKEFSTI